MQSILQFPIFMPPFGPVSRKRIALALAVYAAIFSLAIALLLIARRDDLRALALGLIAPGGGFLYFADLGGAVAAVALFAFMGSLAVWFATGMVLLPPAVWLAAAILAAIVGAGASPRDVWPAAAYAVPFGMIVLFLLAGGASIVSVAIGNARRRRLNAALVVERAPVSILPDISDELSPDDLARLRLLLDRALQPVDAFDGFEWRDQFQTAAVRYQINFISYALSIAQRAYVPAFKGYFAEAQQRLIAKQQNPRVWRYWRLENLWGNFSSDADPFARDNIMFSGFVAAQIACAEAAAGGRAGLGERRLIFGGRSGETFVYSVDRLVDCLVCQYENAPFGLLACEPNWIYPLCNAITASAIRANDARTGATHWNKIAERFRQSLEREFITPSGRFVAFRSSVTGLAGPPVGGAVMQAFPCFFLNSILPDIAGRQWAALREELKTRNLRRALWPIDVGNYRLSRASSYAATAAAAVEMGDSDFAAQLLGALEEECPSQTIAGVSHRKNASLWAHAIEMFARCGRADAFAELVATPHKIPIASPFIEYAAYPDILVAKAKAHDGALSAVLHPGRERGCRRILIGGLMPGRRYQAHGAAELSLVADKTGRARFDVIVDGRAPLSIVPVV